MMRKPTAQTRVTAGDATSKTVANVSYMPPALNHPRCATASALAHDSAIATTAAMTRGSGRVTPNPEGLTPTLTTAGLLPLPIVRCIGIACVGAVPDPGVASGASVPG